MPTRFWSDRLVPAVARTPDRGDVSGVTDDLRPSVGNAEKAEDADVLLDRLALAVRVRVAGRRAAETRLAEFAFTEKRAGDGPDRAAAGLAGASDLGYFVRRALAALGDPAAVQVLGALRQGDRPLDGLMSLIEPAVRDRLVASDLVGGLASAGLASRDLESDQVALTSLGMALLDLVADLERRATAGSAP